MALTPFPSLATLPEVIANNGKIPARSIDVFAARTVYASSIPGVVLDCDLYAGTKYGGGSPTDNASRLNTVLATATAANPVHLIIDGGCALGAPLVIPATGYVTITGHGWHTGIFMLAGSNASAIQNFAHTNLAEFNAWNPPTRPQSIAGSNVTIRDLRIHGNRTNNCNGATDGTLTGQTATPGNLRGPYANVYFLSGIVLVGLDNVLIDRVWVYDAPAYHVNLYHCTRVEVCRCRIESLDPTIDANQDGVHCNGGCSFVNVHHNWISAGDDAIGFNLDEGDGSAGDCLAFTDNFLSNCKSGGRLYGGQGANTKRVLYARNRGTVQWFALEIGNTNGVAGTELNHSTSVLDNEIEVTVSNPYSQGSFLFLNANCGHLEFKGNVLASPTIAVPMVRMTNQANSVSSLKMSGNTIHRSAVGNAACWAFEGTLGSVGDLAIEDFKVVEQSGGGYADIPTLVNLNGTAVAHLTLSAAVKGVGRVLDITSSSTVGSVAIKDLHHQSNAGSPATDSIRVAGSSVPISVGRYSGVNVATVATGSGVLSGPGLVASAASLADSGVGNNSVYYSSTQGGLAYKDASGTVHTFTFGAPSAATTFTLTGPIGGAVSSASTNFTITPNGPYTGTITITPSGGSLSTPIVLTFSGSATPQTFTIKPTTSGTVTLTPTNSGGLTNPSARAYTSGLIAYDAFAGTAGASIIGTTPTYPNGSDTWTSTLSENLNFATGGGATSGGSGSNWSVDYPLIGVSGGIGTYTIPFTNATNASPTLYLRADASGFGSNLISIVFNYADQQVYLDCYSGGTNYFSRKTYATTFAAGATYTPVIALGATTIGMTLNGTPVFSGVTIPAFSGSRLFLRQQVGSAGDVKFLSVNVHS